MKRVSRRRFLKLAGALAAGGLALGHVAPRPRRMPRLVLAMCVDCMRADQAGAYGCQEPTTPCIDALASQAVLFENVHANSNWTKPSVASFFTGLWPGEHGAVGIAGSGPNASARDAGLPDGITTLAGIYRTAGFRTAGFVWQPHLVKEFGFGQGFDTYVTGAMDADRIAALFREWLSALAPGERAFVYLHFLDCHAPYPEHEPYSRLFGSTSRAFSSCPDWRTPGVWAAFREEVNAGKRSMPVEEAGNLLNRYQGDVRFVDSVIGGIVSDLSAKGALDDALVCVFADHGEDFLEHGTLGHDPPFFFEEQIRIPLVVKFPLSWGILPQRRSEETQTIDLTATLAAVAGLRGFGHGRNLLDPVDSARGVYIITESAKGITVIRDGLKAYMSMVGALPAAARTYDLHRDPMETRDVSPEAAGFVDAVESYMALWRESTAKVAAAFDAQRSGATASPENIEALRALGYLH